MSTLLEHDEAEKTKSCVAGKYLTFRLGKESYGVDVLKVREIVRMQSTTGVPQMPDYVKGVINLRGKVIPVIDLRLKLKLSAHDITELTCIIVVQAHVVNGDVIPVGLIVDCVEEVLNVAAAEIEATPDFGNELSTENILGMAKYKGSVKTLLDIEKVINDTPVSKLAVQA